MRTNEAAGSQSCPVCAVSGVAVPRVTLKALLTSDGLRRGVPPSPRYCPNPTCEVVYFDRDPAVSFRESDLIVPVHGKHPGDDAIPVCYCFGYTGKSIRDEIDRTGASSASASISAEVEAGRCACEVRNPRGVCCLGDVTRASTEMEYRSRDPRFKEP